jgi:hypothetical protein
LNNQYSIDNERPAKWRAFFVYLKLTIKTHIAQVKHIIISFFLLTLLISCKKETNNPIVKVQNKIPTYPWRVKEHWVDESTCRKYIYTANNRLSQIKISQNDEEIETITYAYSGNKAIITSSKNNNQYTYFLNLKGLADSCEFVLPGYVYIKRIFLYNSENKIIRKLESGSIVSVPFQQRTEYFYNGSNLVREKIFEEENETIIDYEYDNSLVNNLQGTEFLETFISVQPKLLTKAIFGVDEENTYSYEIESDSVITRNDFYYNGSSNSNTYFLESVK